MAEDKRGLPGWMIFFLVIGLSAVVVLNLVRIGGTPDITIVPSVKVIGKHTPLKIEVAEPKRGLGHVKVEISYGDNVKSLFDKTYPRRSAFAFWGPITKSDQIAVVVGRDTIPDLKGGSAVIRVTADRAETWLRHPDPVVQDMTLPVRLTPPSLQVVSSQTYVAQGGCEAVVYRVGESSVRDGVRSGAWWFPGFPLPGGGKQDRFAFFAVAYDMPAPDVRLVAEDEAGNHAEATFIDQFFPKPPKLDTVGVSDIFINKVVSEILSQTPELQDRGNPLENYLMINRDLRARQNEELKQLAKRSRAEFLWNSPFLMMPNGKVMAAFADRRTYEYGGKTIDHQDHLGYDLAVTQQAPIPSANRGVVILAKYFGIYGNAVIIDHGYGLMSLYGHLSSIAVKEGQQIARGEIVGRTGQTGLAAGDHLHFTLLLQGLPVNPVEWWDGHWLKDRIAKKLGSALSLQ